MSRPGSLRPNRRAAGAAPGLSSPAVRAAAVSANVPPHGRHALEPCVSRSNAETRLLTSPPIGFQPRPARPREEPVVGSPEAASRSGSTGGRWGVSGRGGELLKLGTAESDLRCRQVDVRSTSGLCGSGRPARPRRARRAEATASSSSRFSRSSARRTFPLAPAMLANTPEAPSGAREVRPASRRRPSPVSDDCMSTASRREPPLGPRLAFRSRRRAPRYEGRSLMIHRQPLCRRRTTRRGPCHPPRNVDRHPLFEMMFSPSSTHPASSARSPCPCSSAIVALPAAVDTS